MSVRSVGEDGAQRDPDLVPEPGVGRVGVVAVMPAEDHRHRRHGHRQRAGEQPELRPRGPADPRYPGQVAVPLTR